MTYYDTLREDQRRRLYELSDEQRREILAFFMDHGDHLRSKEEWSMDDNFNCTEGLHMIHNKVFPDWEGASDV